MFPLNNYTHTIPEGDHPGAFGALRKHDVHTGVDLYCDPGEDVYAMEDGLIVGIEDFTGPKANSPWWNDTQALLVFGESGVILYGEIETELKPPRKVLKGERIGSVKTVLKKDKGKPMAMLHMELYTPTIVGSVWWRHGEPKPDRLLDVTPLLKENLNGKRI